mgnify:CR=1 FL=1
MSGRSSGFSHQAEFSVGLCGFKIGLVDNIFDNNDPASFECRDALSETGINPQMGMNRAGEHSSTAKYSENLIQCPGPDMAVGEGAAGRDGQRGG